jgi:hypothetical protein
MTQKHKWNGYLTIEMPQRNPFLPLFAQSLPTTKSHIIECFGSLCLNYKYRRNCANKVGDGGRMNEYHAAKSDHPPALNNRCFCADRAAADVISSRERRTADGGGTDTVGATLSLYFI